MRPSWLAAQDLSSDSSLNTIWEPGSTQVEGLQGAEHPHPLLLKAL